MASQRIIGRHYEPSMLPAVVVFFGLLFTVGFAIAAVLLVICLPFGLIDEIPKTSVWNMPIHKAIAALYRRIKK